MKRMTSGVGIAALFLLPCAHALGKDGGTLDKVRAAGVLSCGLITEEPEYSNLDAHGNRASFDVDLCKAVAVSVLGSGARFNITPYPDETRALEALAKGTVDLIPTATPGFVSQAGQQFAFSATVLEDFQGFLVDGASGIKSSQELKGKKVCYLAETDIEVRLQSYFDRKKLAVIPFPFQEEGEMEAAFITNNCVAISADATQLAYERIAFRTTGKKYLILPDVIVNDPLALTTRRSDPAWTALVARVEQTLREAERIGVDRGNAESKIRSGDPALRRLLLPGARDPQPALLDSASVARTIQAVGNYGEIYERDLGSQSPMLLSRATEGTP